MAESFLVNQPTGAFVLRKSAQTGSLALTHKNSEGRVGHALIYSKPGGGKFDEL